MYVYSYIFRVVLSWEFFLQINNFRTDLFYLLMKLQQVWPLQDRMTLKKYHTPPGLQNWSLDIRCNVVSYPEHFFFCGGGGFLPFCWGGEHSQRILSSTDQAKKEEKEVDKY